MLQLQHQGQHKLDSIFSITQVSLSVSHNRNDTAQDWEKMRSGGHLVVNDSSACKNTPLLSSEEHKSRDFYTVQRTHLQDALTVYVYTYACI